MPLLAMLGGKTTVKKIIQIVKSMSSQRNLKRFTNLENGRGRRRWR